MGQILLGFLGAYLLYNFIFRFLIPLIRVTRQVKRQVRDFQQNVNTQQAGGFHPGGSASGYPGAAGNAGHSQQGSFQGGNFPGGGRPASSGRNGTDNVTSKEEKRPAKDDYIDFEEIK
jgi:hypothetical protein